MLGNSAELARRTAPAGTPSVEVRQRIERSLGKPGGERLRYLRAQEVLEILDAGEAGPLLKKLVRGQAGPD
jgi:hypothetical protein